MGGCCFLVKMCVGRKHGIKPIIRMDRNSQLMVVHPYCSRFSLQMNTTFRTPPFEHWVIKCLIKIVDNKMAICQGTVVNMSQLS